MNIFFMTADCRDDKDIKQKTIQEVNCSWQCAGHEVLIVVTQYITTFVTFHV